MTASLIRLSSQIRNVMFFYVRMISTDFGFGCVILKGGEKKGPTVAILEPHSFEMGRTDTEGDSEVHVPVFSPRKTGSGRVC